MGLEPGSVSPFGLLNNEEADVELYVDQEVMNADIVNFHPNRNEATLELTQDMFKKYTESIRQTVTEITL